MMIALGLDRDGRLGVVHVPLPRAAENEVMVRVAFSAICRTDAKMSRTGHRDLSLPRVLGHEICGRETESGKWVTVWPGQSCQACEACLRMRENLCERMRIMGFHRDGGLAEYAAVPASSLIPVPDETPRHLACLAEPLACTLNALEAAGVSPADRLLVYGAGPVGLMLCLAARARGVATRVIETDPFKLGKSERFTAGIGIEAATQCGDSGFDVAINAAPSLGALLDGISRLKAGGTFCLFSGITGGTSVPVSLLHEVHYRQLRVVGAYGCTRSQMARALHLIADHAGHMESLVEQIIWLDEAPKAIEGILSGQAMKYIVQLPP